MILGDMPSSLVLEQAAVLDSAAIARNVSFIPLHTTTRHRPAGVLSRTNELNRMLAMPTSDDWLEARVKALQDEDSGQRKHSWRCWSYRCHHLNSSQENPRKEGARCKGSSEWGDGSTQQCPVTFSYQRYAHEVRSPAQHTAASR